MLSSNFMPIGGIGLYLAMACEPNKHPQCKFLSEFASSQLAPHDTRSRRQFSEELDTGLSWR